MTALILLLTLLLITPIAYLVCWIIVLTKLFPSERICWGILGIFFHLYPFIWGWQHADRLGIKKVMIIWTISSGLLMISKSG